jgi:succinate dehydrogenase / fumarate reductase membrane anchor subunit
MSTSGDRAEAKASVAHWWHQRLTAVALIPLGLWFAWAVTGIDLGTQAALIAWIARPMNAILLGLLAIGGAYHSWLGVQVVLEDYVPDPRQLLISLWLSLVAHVVTVGACLFAILRVALGAA